MHFYLRYFFHYLRYFFIIVAVQTQNVFLLSLQLNASTPNRRSVFTPAPDLLATNKVCASLSPARPWRSRSPSSASSPSCSASSHTASSHTPVSFASPPRAPPTWCRILTLQRSSWAPPGCPPIAMTQVPGIHLCARGEVPQPPPQAATLP
jgi:hypothetical protein